MHVKLKWSRYRPGVAQRVGRGIALLFHDRGTRRWVVSSTPGRTLPSVPILQQAGWATGPVWTGGKSRPHRDSIPDLPARSQSLYRLSYPVHRYASIKIYLCMCIPYHTWGDVMVSDEWRFHIYCLVIQCARSFLFLCSFCVSITSEWLRVNTFCLSGKKSFFLPYLFIVHIISSICICLSVWSGRTYLILIGPVSS